MDEKKEVKTCPLFKAAAMIGKTAGETTRCIEERCKLYDKDHDECGLKQH